MAFLDYLKDRRILLPVIIVAVLAAADLIYGVHLGIEFIGGTQIPITLEHTVNPDVMSSIISTLQQRINTFGLKQPTIEGIGNSQVYVIIPRASQATIASTIAIIEKQGIFQGIVGGREAINGSVILGGASGIQPSYTQVGSNVTWLVNFYVTQGGALRFSKVAFGQTGKPLYMFLDRPIGAIVLVNQSLLNGFGLLGITAQAEVAAMQSATAFGNRTIPIELLNQNLTNWPVLYSFFSANRDMYSSVILARNTANSIIGNLTGLNYTVIYASPSNMTPQFGPLANSTQKLLVNSWPAIGLLSAPILSAGITNGNASQGYTVSGAAPLNLTLRGKMAFAQNESSTIASVLSGGALPVHVIVGIPITTPPTLGQHFEVISGIALLLAVAAVAMTIVLRYKRFFLITPIILTTVAELFIIGSIIGLLGTIDLSAVAGMIAVIGTGVDAQIIITDEALVGAKDISLKTKLNHAFYVVWADAVLLVIAMLPLLFSTSLITVIGFAESTILGAIFGAVITRPAYGAIISRHYSNA